MWLYLSLLQLIRTEFRSRVVLFRPCSVQENCGDTLVEPSGSACLTMLTYVFAFLAFSRFYVSGLAIPVQHQPRLALPFALKLGQISSTIADYDRSRVRALTAAAQSPASTYKRTVFSNSDVSVNATNAEVCSGSIISIIEQVTD